jgi:uncharacterized protein
MRRSSTSRVASVVVVVALAVGAALVGPLGAPAPPAAAFTPFVAGGSVEQVYVTGLVPGDPVELVAPDGTAAVAGVADAQGAHLFRQVAPGSGYRVVQNGLPSLPLTVLAPDDHPTPAFYDSIVLEEGYGYLPTRDGTLLSVNVHLPDGPGPFPAVIDYSGYDPSAPGGPPQEAAAFLFQGYAVIGVNMRGSGCSGGSFDYFETLQSLDGYDAVEAVAAQPWSNGDVGMVGISYPGISQLFVAATQPPHLRAITPLSVIADTYRSTLFPGGIRNEGFALPWAAERQAAAQPAARPWARQRIAEGDVVCERNQLLRLQSRDLVAEITPDRYYEAAGDALAPRTFVDRITVPVFLSGQFQDEQTGGHFSTMVRDFGSSPVVRVLLTNGTHVEPLGPDQLQPLLEFVDLYVGRRTPRVDPLIRLAVGGIYEQLFGASGLGIGPDRFEGLSPAEARAAYEAEPPVTVLWENGAGRDPGDPAATATSTHGSWPVPEAEPRRWYLDADGALVDQPTATPDDAARGVSAFRYDPSARAGATAGGGVDIWRDNGALDWTPLVDGSARSFVTVPFTAETALAGMGAVDLWLRSTAADTDLEVVLSEVRPDGQERYVQSGWLRASHRALDPDRSTELEPVPTHLEADANPLAAGTFDRVRVPLFPFAHVVRPGSRLRLTVSAPGGNQPLWAFTALGADGDQVDAIAHSVGRPSSLVLPVLPPGVAPDVPEAAPPCPSLRNQPCRPYAPERRALGVTATDAGDGTLTVSWRPPEVGGATGYRVAVRPVGVDDVDAVAEGRSPEAEPVVVDVDGATTVASVPGVAVGTTYAATVTVLDAGTEGLSSSASLPATMGEPVPTTTTTVPPSTTTQATAVVAGTQQLPRTGSDGRSPVVVGLVLVLAGAVLIGLTRRRPTAP